MAASYVLEERTEKIKLHIFGVCKSKKASKHSSDLAPGARTVAVPRGASNLLSLFLSLS